MRGTTVNAIKIERQIDRGQLDADGVFGWPVWEKEVSTFPWSYDAREICYFLEGDVIVTPDGGEPLRMGRGDRVTFSAGMSCTWEIRAPVRKHYRFD